MPPDNRLPRPERTRTAENTVESGDPLPTNSSLIIMNSLTAAHRGYEYQDLFVASSPSGTFIAVICQPGSLA